eukprot:Opistho-1_new@73512
MLHTMAMFFMPFMCSAVITSALPVAVQKMSARSTASSIVTTSKPSIAACSAQIGSISVTRTRAPPLRSDWAEPLPTSPKPATQATPIFIISLPRSGSTLLEQMLGSHPAIEPTDELLYIPAILRSAMEMATRRGPVTVPQLVAGISDDYAAAMGQEYLRRAALHRKTDRPFFIDKLPNNWSNILFIRRILPQARFVDIRRDAMDCCFSNFTQSFSSAHASSFALEDIGRSYTDYVRLMAHFDQAAPGMVHHLSYEQLVEDAEPNLRRTLDYLGLGWDSALLDFHRADRVVRTPSSEQVRRPLNRDGMDIWRPYSQWLDPLREVLGPLAG